MKKIVIFILILIVILSTIYYIYAVNLQTYKRNQEENEQFNVYYDKEISSTELVTVINKVNDINITNNVEKNENGVYINNQINSINVEIKFLDMEDVIDTEKIISSGTDSFLTHYREVNFKCIDIQYHEETQKVKYMLFEEMLNN